MAGTPTVSEDRACLVGQPTPSITRKGVDSVPSNNTYVVPQARGSLDQFKLGIAREVGVNLREGYNGDLTTRQAGHIGGQMVKRMIEIAERNLGRTR